MQNILCQNRGTARNPATSYDSKGSGPNFFFKINIPPIKNSFGVRITFYFFKEKKKKKKQQTHTAIIVYSSPFFLPLKKNQEINW